MFAVLVALAAVCVALAVAVAAPVVPVAGACRPVVWLAAGCAGVSSQALEGAASATVAPAVTGSTLASWTRAALGRTAATLQTRGGMGWSVAQTLVVDYGQRSTGRQAGPAQQDGTTIHPHRLTTEG